MQQAYSWRIIGMLLLSMTLIVTGDAAAKLMTADGFEPVFLAWARFALAAVILAPFCAVKRAELPQFLHKGLILRAILVVCGISCILTALRTEPMANVFGGFFVGPIISYFLATVLLKEPLSIPRTVLLAVSFAGVLIVVRPGFEMTAGMGFAVLAGVFYGSYLVATRWLAGNYRPRFMLISQLVIGALILTPFAIGPLPALSPWIGFLILISAMGSAGGNLLLVTANRTTSASVIAPLIYAQLLVATVLGLVVFGDWPDALTLIGLIVIAVAGITSVWFAGRGR